jgi:hypothetical protein
MSGDIIFYSPVYNSIFCHFWGGAEWTEMLAPNAPE